MEPLAPEIAEFYKRIDEAARLGGGLRQLEFLRTQEIILRHAGDRPGRVLDVGGGPGRYARWLAELGNEVVLIDPVESLVDQARNSTVDGPGAVTAHVGDARHLEVDSAAFDLVLLLGPLYHLQDRQERLRALNEARRAARKKGHVIVAAITRFASLFDGLIRERIFDDQFRAMVDRDLQTGRHDPRGVPDTITTSYFHHPDELVGEVEESGLEVVEVVGLEGMPLHMPHLAERWEEPGSREVLLQAARATESEPVLSAHFLAVAVVP